MAEINPLIQTWGGMPKLMPQQGDLQEPPPGGLFGGLQPGPEGSYFTLSPEVMNMLWAPQTQQQTQPPPVI